MAQHLPRAGNGNFKKLCQIEAAKGFAIKFGASEFKRDDKDRRKPKQNLTAKLLGDPDPERFARSEAIRASVASKNKIKGKYE